jgi:Zn-dependent M28 family amino/carboxypeptidase
MVPTGLLRTKYFFFVSILLALFSCGGEAPKEEKREQSIVKQQRKLERPPFDEDSAYAYIQRQVDFGPRVPNTEAHRNAGNFLAEKLRSFDFNVIEQEGVVTAFNDKKLNIKNIIGEYKPSLNNRVLLFAHWDSRPFADQDVKDKSKPIDGANDGASGVGILLEIGRQIQQLQPNIGVDIIFFDAEDYGQPSGSMTAPKPGTWCLGSQYWGNRPHKAGYRANFGILLDMVAAPNATFTKEAISRYYAAAIVEEVWANAAALGHSNHFIPMESTHVGEDDHLYVNKLLKIPSIDIIQFDPTTGAFGSHWHTHNDNMSIIDKNTIEAVGETVLATVLAEAKMKL